VILEVKKPLANLSLDLNHQPIIMSSFFLETFLLSYLKGIVSPDWKGLQMVSLDKFEV
jgi:hypothetical protein